MRFDIMTLFPEAVAPMLNASILGRAQKKGLIEIHAHQIRDYTTNKQNQVDDYPYGGGRAYRVESSRVQKTCVLVKLAGIDTVEAASALRDQVVSIDRADAQLPQGSIFIADLLGLPVYDGETPIGRLTDVMSTPANDVYVVKGEDGQEHLIPAVPEFVLERNVDEGYIRVRLIEGM